MDKLTSEHLPTTSAQSGNAEIDRLQHLAADEATLNRAELQRLYESATDLVGEVRYHVLWRLNQLQSVCSWLERPLSPFSDWEDLSRLRQEISSHLLAAVRLRQEAQLLMNAYRASSRISARGIRTVSRTVSTPNIQEQVNHNLKPGINV